jgi:hypothetical protein
MAVTVIGKSIVATTTGAVTGRYVIQGIGWEGATAASDRCTINDTTTGAVLFDATPGTTYLTPYQHYDDGLFVDGITVTTLGSGTVTLYLA